MLIAAKCLQTLDGRNSGVCSSIPTAMKLLLNLVSFRIPRAIRFGSPLFD